MTCPECGSSLIVTIVGLYNQCANCGHVWKPRLGDIQPGAIEDDLIIHEDDSVSLWDWVQ